MRWTILSLNFLAAVALIFLAVAATGTHYSHAFSTYRELQMNHAIVDAPKYTSGEPLDVEGHLRKIGGSEYYYSLLGFLGAGACLLNGFVFFFSHAPKRQNNAKEH